MSDGLSDAIVVRPARHADAAAIGAVHVAAWRSAYPGILPDHYLAGLSATRQAAYYDRSIGGGGVLVAARASSDAAGQVPRVVGFATVGRSRSPALAEGEIETLYVLDDWRERGLGRRLLGAAATRLAALGCGSAFLWVLRDNPSRWFYERLGGRAVMAADVGVAGVAVAQVAYAWDPIGLLLGK